MPTAIATLIVPGPSRMTIVSASSSPGIDSSTSTKRMIASSANPPNEPLTTPSTVPSTIPTVTATSAPSSDSDDPWMTRESWSRPTESVPKGWVALGACSPLTTLV